MSFLKRALIKVDTSACLEKIDYQRALESRMVFRFLRSIDIPKGGQRSRLQFPEWHRQLGEYKASYYFALREARRLTIHLSELCMIKWAFHFKQAEAGDECFVTKFYEDFTMDSRLHVQKLNWQVTLIF